MQRYKFVNCKTLESGETLPDSTEQTAWAMSHDRLKSLFREHCGVEFRDFVLVGDEGRTILYFCPLGTFVASKGHAIGLSRTFNAAWG